MTRRWMLILTLAAVLLGQTDGLADEMDKRARSAISRFKAAYRSKDPDTRCNALLELSMVQHESVVKEMGKVLKRDKSEEVRKACAMVLGDMTDVKEAAGELLKAYVKPHEKFPGVLTAIGDSIRTLRYEGAHDELLWMLDHKDQWVVVAAIRAVADVKDLKALPKLYDMAEYQGTGYSWSTGSVTVDTGASGDTDQKAAEAAWHAKYGGVRPRKAGPTVVKLYMRHLREAVEKLTGEKFKDLGEFKAWIEAHPKEVGQAPDKRRR